MQHLRAGDIVALDDEYTFIQRIPRSHYVLSVGPVPYLYFSMRCVCWMWR
jgi:two-component system sensor histidine kinase RstB